MNESVSDLTLTQHRTKRSKLMLGPEVCDLNVGTEPEATV